MNKEIKIRTETNTPMNVIELIKSGMEKGYNVEVLDIFPIEDNTFDVLYKCLVTGDLYTNQWEVMSNDK